MRTHTEQPADPSRREFLQASLAIGGSLLALLALPPRAIASLEKVLDTREFRRESFDALVASLRNDVWERDTEVIWAHMKKGGVEYAVNVLKRGAAANADAIDLLPIYEDLGVENLTVLHTHPAVIFESESLLPLQLARRIRRERIVNYPLIPSHVDLFEYIAGRILLELRGIRRGYRDFLIEPSGLWTYDLEFGHPFVRRHVELATQTPQSDTQGLSMVYGSGALNELKDFIEHEERAIWAAGGMTDKLFASLCEKTKEKFGITLSYERNK